MLVGLCIFWDPSITGDKKIRATMRDDRKARFSIFSTNHLFGSILLFYKMQISISKVSKAWNIETLVLSEDLLVVLRSGYCKHDNSMCKTV